MSKPPTIFYLMILSVISFYSFAEKNTRVITENYPPLNYLDKNNLSGAAVEIVQAIQQQISGQSHIEILPWKRAYLTTLHTPNTALFSLSRSVKRENQFKWAGPIAKKKYAFYAMANSPIQILSLNDASHYLIGVVNGSINEEFLLNKGLNSLSPVNTPLQNLGKLIKGRIDLWYTSAETMASATKSMSIDTNSFTQLFVVKNEYLYIGFNINTPDNVVSNWQNIYQHLHKTGRIKNIYQSRNEIHMYPEIIVN